MIKVIRILIYYLKNNFFIDRYSYDYISHNKNIWSKYKVKKNNNNVILIDLFQKYSHIHFWSYISNVLANYTKSKIKFSYIRLYKGRSANYNFFLRRIKKIYNSFNAHEGINELNFELSEKEIKKIDKLFKNLNFDKKKLETFTIDNIKIGDLIYDTYLRATYLPTIDMKDSFLRELFFRSLKIYYETKFFFKKYNVKAVIPSHTCYHSYGIICRIAALKKIPILKVNADARGNSNFRVNLVDKKYVNEEAAPYFNFSKVFKTLDNSQKKNGLYIGKKILNNRLNGKFEKSLSYMSGRQFQNKKKSNKIKRNKKKKIIIFPHCYFDNPHRFRYMIFSDFYDQINFILNLSKKFPNYDWYYKPHPHELKSETNVHKDILKKFPHVIYLNPNTSHKEIIKAGPSCIITNHGTVGHEYAAFKIPVIFTGDNKHINYKFGLHIKSKNQLFMNLKNLEKLKYKINFDKNKIYEFVFMNYFYYQNLYSREKLINDKYFTSSDKKIADTSKNLTHILKNNQRSHIKIIKYVENIIKKENLFCK